MSGWLCPSAGWRDGDHDCGLDEIFSADPRLGFLSAAADFQAKIDSGTGSAEQINAWQQQILNNQINAVVTGAFLLLVLAIVAACGREWWQLLAAKKVRYLHEEPYIAISVG
jgi:carbon starvation protein